MTFLIFSVFYFCLCTSSENVPPTSGFYTGDLNKVINKFEIVYPERVSKDGSFVSYYLPHYYNIESMENRPRRHPGQTGGSESGDIHFHIPIEGKQYHLKLWPNWNFLTPGLVVEKRDARNSQNINKAKIKQVSKRQCHYVGEIVGQPSSNVALSTCNGLAGYIRVPDVDEYLIEPLKDSKPTTVKEHPHIIYKRSDIKDKSSGSNCLTKGKAKDAFNERMQWEAIYGDQVQQELSGININELVRESVKSSPEDLSEKFNSLNSKFSHVDQSSDFDQTDNKLGNNNNINNKNVQQNTHYLKPDPSENFIANSLSQFNAINNKKNPIIESQLKNNHLKEEVNAGRLILANNDLKVLSKNPFKTRKLRSCHSIGNKTGIYEKRQSPEHMVYKRNLETDNKFFNYNLNNQQEKRYDNNKESRDPETDSQKRQNSLTNKIYKNGKNINSVIASENDNLASKIKYPNKFKSKSLSKDVKISSYKTQNLNDENILRQINIDNPELRKQHDNNKRDNIQQLPKRFNVVDLNNLKLKPQETTNIGEHNQLKPSSNLLCSSNNLENEIYSSKLKDINNENLKSNNKVEVDGFDSVVKNANTLKVRKETNNLIVTGNELTGNYNKETNVLESNCPKSCNTPSKFNEKESLETKAEFSNEPKKQDPTFQNLVDSIALQTKLKNEPRVIAKNMMDSGLIKDEESTSKDNLEFTTHQDIALVKDSNHDSDVTAGINEPPTVVKDVNKLSKLQRKLETTMLNTQISNAEFARSDHNEESKSCGNNNATSVNSNKKRQVWPDDCSVETTTPENLLCFDFFNKVFNLELMITVDYKVVKMHAEDDIENFILTVINMVSGNFYDSSIGMNLSIFLVRLILLTTCIKELDSDRFNPEELLENFCTWQVLINPGKDDHPHHHDLAIFVTRMDKCAGQVMGVTYMTSICRPDKACIVCVDEGLLLANTITHQIGHALGAEHDDSEGSGCPAVLPDGTSFHMAPKITEASSAWSVCSKDAMTQFVKSQGSWCLTDLPIERQFNFPLILPGQVYSAAQQCKLNFHMTAFPCLIGPFCEKLYCQVTEKLCATKGDPPADGTFCASDMWCFHKQCVHVGRRPGAISGEWGPWTEWSLCTRSCGGGVAGSYRICNNPKPSNGGRYCIGERIRHKMCHTKPCQGFTESFRDFQCKKTEDRPFRGRLHNWIQYHSFFVNIECSLICQNRKGEVVMRSPIVADGTPCKAGTRNVCIQGTCRNVGCDWVIDSMAKEDACGICQGNGTECRIVQGTFDEAATGKGLIEFLRVPKDSGMIFVREIAASANTIVVSGAINHVFYVNGQGTEDTMPGDITLGLTHGVYEVRSGMERVFIRGPTTEDLVFYVQFQEPNRGIHYQYAVSGVDPSYAPRYLWQYIDWDACTDPCSGGAQRAHAKCVEDRGGVVDDKYCSESTRLLDVIRPCNDFPCHAKWWVSVWSDCICTGSSSVMFRSVLCMRANDESGTRSEIVKESECAAHKKPSTQKPCNVTDYEDECVIKRSVLRGNNDRVNREMKREINSSISLQSNSTTKGLQTSQLPANDILNGKEINKSLNSVDSQKKNAQLETLNANPSLKESSQELSQVNEIDKIRSLKNASSNHESPSFVLNSNLVDITPETKDSLLVKGKENQVVSFNSKPNTFQKSEFNDMQVLFKGKQNNKDSDSNCQSEKMCETTKVTCPPIPPETTEPITCRQTCPVQPHEKTICCKPHPTLPCAKPSEITTKRTLLMEVDEMNMKNFALTVVPLNIPKQKKVPQSDPEFINLGNIGEFGVGDEANATIITGQEALDLLDFARRSNASEESGAHNEEMHS